jgi:hypothetical protein
MAIWVLVASTRVGRENLETAVPKGSAACASSVAKRRVYALIMGGRNLTPLIF